jgi:hypothetical protein
MSKFKQFDFGKIRNYSLKDRHSKVTANDFAKPLKSGSLSAFSDSLPKLLAARDLRLLVHRMRSARDLGKPIIWGFGGHVIKVGLSPILIELMDRGFITAFATNGSGIIHDFEIALCGRTSEEVEQELKTGRFGMAEETGVLLNQAIKEGHQAGVGIGEAVGAFLSRIDTECPGQSLTLQAYRHEIPLTVHVAVGTDIIHCHSEVSGEALGQGALIDFRIFVQQVSELSHGGVYLNTGSAVILPEVFLKAVSAVRNTGQDLDDFATANMDFIQHYRPSQNVLKRPVAEKGVGIALTGHHEIMIPLLAGLLIHAGDDEDWGSDPGSK